MNEWRGLLGHGRRERFGFVFGFVLLDNFGLVEHFVLS